jgi:hypothetical protein
LGKRVLLLGKSTLKAQLGLQPASEDLLSLLLLIVAERGPLLIRRAGDDLKTTDTLAEVCHIIRAEDVVGGEKGEALCEATQDSQVVADGQGDDTARVLSNNSYSEVAQLDAAIYGFV